MFGLLHRLYQRFGMSQKTTSSWREFCAASTAPKQSGTQLFLQCLDASAYGGLSNVQALRSTYKITGSSDSKKSSGEFNFHNLPYLSNLPIDNTKKYRLLNV